jgi:hypothetical protein
MVPLKSACFFGKLEQKSAIRPTPIALFLDGNQIRNEAAGMPLAPTCMLNIFPA